MSGWSVSEMLDDPRMRMRGPAPTAPAAMPTVMMLWTTDEEVGSETSRAAIDLAQRVGCELPIASQVANVIWAATPVPTALEKLLSRTPKEEDA